MHHALATQSSFLTHLPVGDKVVLLVGLAVVLTVIACEVLSVVTLGACEVLLGCLVVVEVDFPAPFRLHM